MVQVLPYDFPDSCVIIVTGKIMANEGVAFREIGTTNTIFTRPFNAHIIAPLTEHRCQVYPEVVVIADGYDRTPVSISFTGVLSPPCETL